MGEEPYFPNPPLDALDSVLCCLNKIEFIAFPPSRSVSSKKLNQSFVIPPQNFIWVPEVMATRLHNTPQFGKAEPCNGSDSKFFLSHHFYEAFAWGWFRCSAQCYKTIFLKQSGDCVFPSFSHSMYMGMASGCGFKIHFLSQAITETKFSFPHIIMSCPHQSSYGSAYTEFPDSFCEFESGWPNAVWVTGYR